MGDSVSRLSHLGFTQICVARGSVSWGSKNKDEAGELQLWYRERDNNYQLNVSNTASGETAVCKVIDVFTSFTLHFRKCTKQNVINDEVEISFRPKTNSTV